MNVRDQLTETIASAYRHAPNEYYGDAADEIMMNDTLGIVEIPDPTRVSVDGTLAWWEFDHATVSADREHGVHVDALRDPSLPVDAWNVGAALIAAARFIDDGISR